MQRRRSIRRFKTSPNVSEGMLVKLVDAARLAPSGGNLQPLEYIIVKEKEAREALFECLEWEKMVKGGGVPADDKKPPAYIVVLINRNVLKKGGFHEVGAAVQNILLLATEDGYGSCWIRSADKEKIKNILSIPEYCEVDSVVALGIPAESPMTEASNGPLSYWRDERGVLHVPKRSLEQILHRGKYDSGIPRK